MAGVKKVLGSLTVQVVASLIATGLIAAAGFLLGDIPLWVALVVALIVGLIGFVVGAMTSTKSQLYPFYAEHIHDVLESVQKVLAGEIPGVDIDDLIEKGILGPARHWLRHGPADEVRLMVIAPKSDEPDVFELLWAEGHSLEAREKFRLKIAGSFAGLAYSTKKIHYSNDVTNDTRWEPHPDARPGREYNSLVSVPLRRGNEVVGVLNAVCTQKGAFTRGDLQYIELLGSLVNVIWGLADTAEEAEDGSDDAVTG